jgi:Macrocin-O-methyltransferase (TylF)
MRSIESLTTIDPSSPDGLEEMVAAIEAGNAEEAFTALNLLKARQVPIANVDMLRAQCFVKMGQPYAAMEALKEELRYFPNNQSAASQLAALAPVPPKPTSTDPEFCELFGVVRPYTMLSEARLVSLHSLARAVCEEDLPGNFVECGVAAGGSSGLLSTIIARHSRRPRKLFSFDTFAGMPKASDCDLSYGKHAEATGWGTGTCSAPESSLRDVCAKLGVESLVQPVKGLFSETLPVWRERVGPIALLHMDADWYTSTLDILENLFDQIVPGGRVQIDDYGYWEGCRRAVNEFEQRRGLHFQVTTIDETGVWFRR